MTLLTEATQSKNRVQAQDKFELDFTSLLETRSGKIMMSKSKVKRARKTVFMKHVFDKNEYERVAEISSLNQGCKSMLSIDGGKGGDLAKLTIFRYWGDDLAKLIIF